MASKKKSHKKRKPTYATKKKLSKKPASKKPVDGTLRKSASNKETSTKPRTTKRVKKVARKATRKTSNVRYTTKSIRTPRKYANRTRKFKIKKKSQKFSPALKPTKENIEKLAKNARAYTKKSKAKIFIKLKVKSTKSKSESWISLPRNQLSSDKKITDGFETLAEYIQTEKYGIDAKISHLEIEQNI